MRKVLLSIVLLTATVIGYAQNYYMTGTFVNRFPSFQSIDSTSFTFTPTGYAFHINGSATPTSSGTYQIKKGANNEDTLVLTESSGACLSNGGSNPVKFKVLKNPAPFNYLYLYETTQSQTNCSVFSDKIAGDYEATTGKFMSGGVGINQVAAAYKLSVYPNPAQDKIVLKYSLEEEQKISIYLTDIQGRVVMEVLNNEQQAVRDHSKEIVLSDRLAAGSYLLCIAGANGISTVRITK